MLKFMYYTYTHISIVFARIEILIAITCELAKVVCRKKHTKHTSTTKRNEKTTGK